MKRVSVSLREETYNDVDRLAECLGCSRSALIDVILSRGLLKHLRARAEFVQIGNPQGSATKRLRGQSIRDLEESIDYLETNYQGELWDAATYRAL